MKPQKSDLVPIGIMDAMNPGAIIRYGVIERYYSCQGPRTRVCGQHFRTLEETLAWIMERNAE